MQKLSYILVLITTFLISLNSHACTEQITVCNNPTSNSFALIKNNQPSPILVENSADTALQKLALSFSQDLAQISGNPSNILHSLDGLSTSLIVIGQLGQSKIIDDLVKAKKLDLSGLAGQWEAYRTTVVDNPWPNVEQALVIVGSDRRGAIFGTYDLSEQMGVSPWYWFADVPVEKKTNLYLTAGTKSDQPKVRYRGIFINDEDPALSSWAKKHFNGVNADMYQHVFELILRLKGNYIWPAMWGKAIHFDDPKSTALADDMGIVLGTSHHEPMTRAHAEWHRYPDDPSTGGAWDYATNAENLRKFWRGGIERMMSKGDGKGYESLVTVGMRGDGDEPMSEETATQLLEKIVDDQRKIIADVTGKPSKETPQVWALYKEVQSYYDQGMKVPDDVTLLFADDNWGQIRRLPTKDLDRKGGFGVYYHFDYVGAPRNYKWLNTTQISKVWQQMDLAYQRNAKNIWVVNVGDIKPMEYPIDFFMEMAWDPEKMDLIAANSFPQKWASQTFGPQLSQQISELVTTYSRYASRRKPELINETVFPIGEATKDWLDGGEFGVMVEQWHGLIKQLQQVKNQIKPEQQDAFFQLVEFPILALSNLYDMYFATAWNKKLAAVNDPRANYFYTKVEETFNRDAMLANQYHSINNGKWHGMMSQVHMNYVSWNDPKEEVMPKVSRVEPVTSNHPIKFKASRAVNRAILDIEAIEYTRVLNKNGISWTKVANLGQASAAMISYPQGQPSNSTDNAARLEYDFTSSEKQNLTVKLLLGPTLDTIGQGGVKIGFSLDQQPVKIINLALQPTCCAPNTPEKRAWFDAVINHGSIMSATFENIRPGKHTLKIHRIDDNVILEKITIVGETIIDN